jgi:hypothetical protein
MRRVLFISLILFSAVSSVSSQVLKTGNTYVSATIEALTGLVTIRLAPGTNFDPILSYPQKSFVYVMVGDRIFTNNNIGLHVTDDPRYGGFLSDGVNQKIADTVRTTWSNKNGCDIIQDVYPVLLDASGQIVIKWKVKNNSNTPVWGQAQFLLDIAVVDDLDAPPILSRGGYRQTWERADTANDGISWFFAAFENKLPNAPSFDPGISGMGYTYDVNHSLGLKKPKLMTYGDWGSPLGSALVDNLWGPPSNVQWGTTYSDPAILFEWDGVGIAVGKTTEIARTSYGTGEYALCYGQLFGLVLYPRRFHWNTSTYQPNPGVIEFYAFNSYSPNPQDSNYGPASSNTYLKLHVGPNLRVTYPSLNNENQKRQQQLTMPSGYISPSEVGIAFWHVVADKQPGCKDHISSWLKFTAEGSLSAVGPIFTGDDTCEHNVLIDCPDKDILPPIADNLKSTSSFPYTRTFDVHDDRTNDEGLDKILGVAQPGSNTDLDKFSVSVTGFDPCSKAKQTVTVIQLDSTAGGCFDFTLTDCGGNDTLYSVCLPAMNIDSPPDTLPPVVSVIRKIVGVNGIPPCDGLCDSILITETRSYDVGLRGITVAAPNNMQVFSDNIPIGSPTQRLLICVLDSTKDASITIRATDTVGNYTDATFCYDVAEGSVLGVEAINDLELIGNPASKQTVLRITLGVSQTVNISVLDMTGRVISTRSLGMLPPGVTDTPISTTELAGGTYYIVAEWDGRQYAKKLSVIK